ncbi:DUF1146 family protein [Paenibacillus sp. JX-17]|uniref:DUF1146 family protein n=1 Tax=Paenibacillus lacisoli TaxID=3064525 RepID=A0ABT9CB98_9BACL|nr:DUF1146 family protein [Paenibacillus sp. JX-17]MDO7906528.1 DUF1146 family protein [Paenibacillus sp. JX-17]
MGNSNELAYSTIGTNGLISMIVSLICIALAWWALQGLKLDLWIRHAKSAQGRMLHLFLAIILGHFVAKFLLEYITWSQMLKLMF